ncbi:MAG TPA: methyltransferase domain-containing protein [Burkholderiales bacterium]|nr:methyltransferase domain-containing protein [Burkholderiales bacterium]
MPSSALAQGEDKELDTPYVPTPQAVVNRMLELAQVKPGDTVIDLGSGDGRIMITAAQKYGARGFGVELDPRLVQRSNDEARRAGVADRVKFLQQDLFKTDFHEASVLTLYLLPDVNMALRPKILAELKPGTRVVSHDYGMREWRPDTEETVPAPDKTVGARKESTVYLWIVPAKVGGVWDMEIAVGRRTRRLPLALEQRYQNVSGTVGLPGNGGLPISDGRLHGDELRLAMPGGTVAREPVELVGHVAEDSLSGTVRRADREIATWSARRRF